MCTCWNNVIRRLFGFNKWDWESVIAMLLGIARLNVNHLIMLLTHSDVL